jgi:hypothetical protein
MKIYKERRDKSPSLLRHTGAIGTSLHFVAPQNLLPIGLEPFWIEITHNLRV